MTTLIIAVLTAIGGFVAGVLVGRRNVNSVNTAVNAANKLASTVATDVKKL